LALPFFLLVLYFNIRPHLSHEEPPFFPPRLGLLTYGMHIKTIEYQ
jgi:hypothetical protein